MHEQTDLAETWTIESFTIVFKESAAQPSYQVTALLKEIRDMQSGADVLREGLKCAKACIDSIDSSFRTHLSIHFHSREMLWSIAAQKAEAERTFNSFLTETCRKRTVDNMLTKTFYLVNLQSKQYRSRFSFD